MKLHIFFLFSFFSSLTAAQEFTCLHKSHVFTVAEDGQSFVEEVIYTGLMPANQSEVISVYFTELEVIEDLRVEIWDLKGTKKKLKRKDIVQSSVNTSHFYAGLQRYSFQLPADKSPYNVTYSYTRQHQDLMFLASLDFYYKSNEETIQYELRVPNSYTLTHTFSEEIKTKKILEYHSRLHGDFTHYTFLSEPDRRDTIPKQDLPYRETIRTIIHPKDIGEVVAEILSDDKKEKHIGKRYDLTGSKTYSASDVAQSISEVLNQDIEYIPITVDQWIDAIKDHPTLNPFLAKHLREFSIEVSDGRFNKTTSVVKDITGHEPRSFKQYIEEHQSVFMN